MGAVSQSEGEAVDLQLRAELRRLFHLAENIDSPAVDFDEPYTVFGFGPRMTRSVLFRGDGLQLLNRLAGDLSSHALAARGIRPETMRAVIARACRVAFEDGDEAGCAVFEAQLSKPTAAWIATVGSDDRADLDLVIGDTRLTRERPSQLDDLIPDSWPSSGRFGPPYFSTNVEAKDSESAAVAAADRVDEVRAVLALGHQGRVRPVRPAMILWQEDTARTTNAMGVSRPRLDLYGYEDPQLGWIPGMSNLAKATAKQPSERSDWERRVMSACRWTLAAQESRWYAQSLVSLMVALECLFVPRGVSRGKGARLAARGTAVSVLPGRSAEQQTRWLERLYRRRNEAAHEGLPVLEDLDVEDLVVLAQRLLHWAVWHLDPGHAPHGGCTTIAQVEDDDLHKFEVRRGHSSQHDGRCS